MASLCRKQPWLLVAGATGSGDAGEGGTGWEAVGINEGVGGAGASIGAVDEAAGAIGEAVRLTTVRVGFAAKRSRHKAPVAAVEHRAQAATRCSPTAW